MLYKYFQQNTHFLFGTCIYLLKIVQYEIFESKNCCLVKNCFWIWYNAFIKHNTTVKVKTVTFLATVPLAFIKYINQYHIFQVRVNFSNFLWKKKRAYSNEKKCNEESWICKVVFVKEIDFLILIYTNSDQRKKLWKNP